MALAEEQKVIIAGAGPVGLTSAVYLAKHGIPVVVYEAADDLPTDLRASTFHPPTLDMLDEFEGVTDQLISQGLVARHWQYRDREEGAVATWDMGVLKDDTNHPYRLQTEQWKLTRVLKEELAKFPHAELHFGHEVLGAVPEGDTVSVSVKGPDGERQVKGRYAIACEGANSAIRRSLDIPYDGLTFPELFLTVTTSFEFRDYWTDLTLVNYISDPGEWLVLLRVAGSWRVLFPTKADEDREAALRDDVIQARLKTVIGKDVPYEVMHKTHYAVHQRVADRYRAGNVFLAGDAAHINNPLGGMGMNGGIQDAFNLVEKMRRVWRGEAEDALLDQYEVERRAMALGFVQESSIRNRKTLMETDPVERRKRHDEMRRMSEDPASAREFLLGSSMIEALRKYEQKAAA